MASLNERERARVRNEDLAFVFQDLNLILQLTLLENVALPLKYRGVPAKRRMEMAREALAEVGLCGLFDRLPSEVSGGEEQRAAIARALVMRPKLLLCDEPTGSLDPENEAIVLTLFQKLVERGTALIVVTHNPSVAAFCDRSLRLRAGRLVSDG